ncbi:MAG TPA: hypothetical protein VGD69_21610 [Herpetosiphonaceae bacterium]
MRDFSGKTAQRARAWNEEAPPKVLPWLPASILAGLVGGVVAPLVFLLLLHFMYPSTSLWAIEMPSGARYNPVLGLVFFYLLAGISGAAGGAAAGLIFYATRRKPLRRAARWSMVWAAIGLFGYMPSMMTVDWIMRMLPSTLGSTRLLLGFMLVGAALSVLTAAGIYVIDPDGEEYG